jgi:Protein of unknown function (DUF1552)
MTPSKRNKMMFEQTRRRFLQGTSLAAGSLFLPSLLGDRAAYAQTMPKRIVVFYTQHGPVTGLWEMRPGGMPGTPDAEWELPLGPLAATDFSAQLAPLYASRNDLLVLEGVALTSAIADKQGNNHGVAGNHHFTAAMDGTKHVSFDQYIADQIAVPGRFKYLGFTPNGGDVNNAGFFDTAGDPVTLARTDNYYGFLGNQYARVFDGLSMPVATPTGKPTGMDLSRARRQASVEFVQGQYAKLAGKLSGDDRAKLTLHHDMLSDLALRVAALAQLKCEKPTYPAKGTTSDAQVMKLLMTNLMPVAMACDLTRVGLLHHTQWAAADLGAPSTLDVHQDIAHAAATPGQPQDWMVNYYKLHAGQFNDMIAAFKAVPEGSGTMLDNTVLIWMNELANGGHDLFRMMYVIAGGKNLGLRPGRYLKYAETGPNPYNLLMTSPYGNTPGGNYGSDKFGLGPAHSQLMVSLMQAFGVNKTSIGLAAAVGTGYMKGVPIALTGPLPRLT